MKDQFGQHDRRISVRIKRQFLTTIGQIQVFQLSQAQNVFQIGLHILNVQIGHEQMCQAISHGKQTVQAANKLFRRQLACRFGMQLVQTAIAQIQILETFH
jgi:hypothetical protein